MGSRQGRILSAVSAAIGFSAPLLACAPARAQQEQQAHRPHFFLEPGRVTLAMAAAVWEDGAARSSDSSDSSEAPLYAFADPFGEDAPPPATGPTTSPGDATVAPPTEPAPEDLRLEPTLPAPRPPRPHGFAGRFGDRPSSSRGRGGEFLPIPDRWRIGLPEGYGLNTRGNFLDPYGQNVLKGDYPVFGTQDVFFVLGLTSDTLIEARRTPTPSGVSAADTRRFDFFGQGDSQFVVQNLIVSASLFRGDTAFRPRDWEVRATAVFNLNYLLSEERGVIDPDVREGRDRLDTHVGMQELFYEQELSGNLPTRNDRFLSPNFDFVSVRAGIQGFGSDFRGFLFSDNEPGIRLFGTYDNNQWQYNLAWFHQLEKDTNSGLNTWDARSQNVFIANLYRQDLIWEGYTGQLSFHANIDHGGGVEYDTNGFVVRPAPVGTIREKDVEAYYVGWAGDGHIGRLNITHQYYYVFGTESFNPISDREVDISAHFAAVELSYDFDYIRYRASVAYASGDGDPEDGTAEGFDTIFDNPNFAGGGFSYFTRQAVRLAGTSVGLVGRNSLVPNLRTSKEQGQANFVNPGLLLYNVGMDVEVTPKLKLITNASYLQFDETEAMALILQDANVDSNIGVDVSLGVEYRPLLNQNVLVTFGAAALFPGKGFDDLYSSEVLYSTFLALTLTY